MRKLAITTIWIGVVCLILGLLASIDPLVGSPMPAGAPAFVLVGVLGVIVGCALLAQTRVINELRARVERPAACPTCNYDLRGNPAGVTGCPECGWGRSGVNPPRRGGGV